MTDSMQIQIALDAPPDVIMRAWTESLPAWFAEHSDVSVADKRYDFWGRYTPGTPDREAGRHPLLDYQAGQSLKFSWTLAGKEHDFTVSVHTRAEKKIVVVQQDGGIKNPVANAFTYEDFWFLSLENLRRHLDGKPPIRCDFSASMLGDVHHSLEIDAPPEAVYGTLILPEQLERWIASHATVEPHVGGLYDFGWPEQSGALRILEIVPNEKLSLSWSEGERETVITWTLEGSGGKTRLTLVHSGFAPDEENGGIYTGWMNFMSWIKSLNEYGATWQPAVRQLQPESESMYPASIASAQDDLISGNQAEMGINTSLSGDYKTSQ